MKTSDTYNKMIGVIYNELKTKYHCAVILFETGGFYLSYYDDAEKVSEVLGVAMIHRSGDNGYNLTGFQHYELDAYLPKLIRAGYRVAICDLPEYIRERNSL